MKSSKIWFWQRVITPHMAYLAIALAKKGIDVTYVAEESMSSDRAAQGWQAPNLPGVTIYFLKTNTEIDRLLSIATKDSIHICQGIRGNGMIHLVEKKLSALGRRFWIVMETIDDAGAKGFLKRLYYHFLLLYSKNNISGFLAIGHKTTTWLQNRGISSKRIHPFTYFLNETQPIGNEWQTTNNKLYKILFVGQLIQRKQLDLLFKSLEKIPGDLPFSLQIIGTGPLETELKSLGKKILGSKVEWLGKLTMEETRNNMLKADCLVLPSAHDGWGAVVSEALMAGTPAICSENCGATEAVLASGVGGVFPSGDQKALSELLAKSIALGPQTLESRSRLSRWGQAFGATNGAEYLIKLLTIQESDSARPAPPWRRS
ncbi:glycosyltransferase family 4 protein [Malikia spinosa]|uniref:glycosyltransferase family 4 protein n=1 Tax=Malikia spinosa TaxID=86180 RepID=UPI002FDB86B7